MSSGGELRHVPGTAEVGVNLTRFDCAPHFHDTYTISVFRTRARVWCRGRFWDVAPGQIVVGAPREPHWGEADAAGCSQDMVDPAPAMLERLFGRPEPVRFPSPVIDDPALAADLRAALAAADRGCDALEDAIFRLFAIHGVPAEESPADGAAAAALTAEAAALLDAPVAVQARRAGVSRSHFSRLFRSLCGMSPRDYRRQARVRAARALIEGGAELSMAAAEAGFADQAHMTRQVRSILGVSPRALRTAPRT